MRRSALCGSCATRATAARARRPPSAQQRRALRPNDVRMRRLPAAAPLPRVPGVRRLPGLSGLAGFSLAGFSFAGFSLAGAAVPARLVGTLAWLVLVALRVRPSNR